MWEILHDSSDSLHLYLAGSDKINGEVGDSLSVKGIQWRGQADS